MKKVLLVFIVVSSFLLSSCISVSNNAEPTQQSQPELTQTAQKAEESYILLTSFAENFGVTLLSQPEKRVGAFAEVDFSSEKNLSLLLDLTDKASGKSVKTAVAEKEGAVHRVFCAFPSSGDYELKILGKEEKAPNTYYEMIRVRFEAAVDTPVYFYSLSTPFETKAIMVTGMKTKKEQWYPAEMINFSYSQSQTAALVKEISLKVGKEIVSVPVGEAVTFCAPENNISGFSFPLDRDVAYEESGNRIVFKKGSSFFFSRVDMIGNIALEQKISLQGNSFLCPEDSRLIFYNGELSAIELSRPAALNINGQMFPCKDGISMQANKEGENLYITLGKDMSIPIASEKINTPEGSYLCFRNGRVEYIVFSKNSSSVVRGAKKDMEEGFVYFFDEEGNITDGGLGK
jgi:hypothetical protein